MAILGIAAVNAKIIDEPVYEFDIPAQPLIKSLNALSNQTETLVLFPYDLVKNRIGNAVKGQFTVVQALDKLLLHTGLVGGRSKKGVLTISQLESATANTRGVEKMKSKKSILAAIVGFFVGAGGTQADERREIDKEASNPTSMLEEVVVTAQKREQNLQDIPMSINAFSADRLAESGVKDINDIQFLAAGLKIGDFQNLSFVTMRGIGSNLFGQIADPGVAAHLDGVYLARRYHQSRAFFDVERVEVLRGPQGTLYGRNATGGAINIITREPTPEPEFGVGATFGNYNLVETEGFASGPLAGEALQGRIAFKTAKHDGYTPNIFNGTAQDDDNAKSVRARLKYEPSDNFRADFIVDYSRDTGVGVGVPKRFSPSLPALGEQFGGTLASGRQVNFDAETAQKVETWGATAKLQWDFTNTRLTSITAYRDLQFLTAYDVDYTEVDIAYFKEQTEENYQISQEINLASTGGGNVEWLIGAFYFYEEGEANLDIPFPGLGFDLVVGPNLNDAESYALFSEGTYHFTDQLSLTLGARYSRDEKSLTEATTIFNSTTTTSSSKSWNSFTPKISLTYRPNDNVTSYATISRGFKSGGFNVGSPYDPEIVINYEIGLKTSLLDDRLRTNISGFWMDYSDLQVAQLENLLFSIRNAAEATIRGVEVEFQAQPTWGFALDGNITYLDATYDKFLSPDAVSGNAIIDVSGNRLTSAPKWSANLGAQYKIQLGEAGTLALRGEYSYQSEVFFQEFNDQSTRQEPYHWFNARLTFEHINNWQVSAFVKNITDELVVGKAQLAAGILGFPVISSYLAPRTYGIAVGYNF